MCIPYRLVDLVKAAVLLMAADQGLLELSAEDKSFISKVLDGHEVSG